MILPISASLSQSAIDALRCQETLAPLVKADDGLKSTATGRHYPVRDGLVFAGFDARNAERISRTLREERAWQSNLSPETVARDLRFLRTSAPFAADLVNLVRRAEGGKPGKSLEIGAGSGWVSWLFAQSGYDPWICDFEANSLALGWLFDHPRLGPGKRIVSDATVLPFADGFFDLVICKEFAHHIENKEALFAEANRVLKPGGRIVIAEPTRNLWYAITYLRRPDPHAGHVIGWAGEYLCALRRSGFAVTIAGIYSNRETGRLPLLGRWRRSATEMIRRGTPRMTLNTWLLGHLFGGELVGIGRKEREAIRGKRPPIEPIEPSTLTITDTDREIYRQYRPVVEEAVPRIVSH